MATVKVPSTMYSVRYGTMITCSNSLSYEGDGASNQGIGLVKTVAIGSGGLPRERTALLDLFIVLPGAQHPIQANRQFPCDCRFGDTVMFIPRQAKVLPMPGRITCE